MVDADFQVDQEHSDRRASGCRASNQAGTYPSKMSTPGLPARMKQAGQLAGARIETCDVGAFERIAIKAT
jgi:hypothetical protein